ncbi:hypothetical protein TanjilG_01067 [Lupinus angustifolius]|uniref:Uncharacterized protein n=1 Tax=Lupinus angustifolius TaxID=3871 RepID=A0A1J7HRW0_LUPAN|nr:hypothetical protein TanjilG_01067 [Lupinus angustifolius]
MELRIDVSGLSSSLQLKEGRFEEREQLVRAKFMGLGLTIFYDAIGRSLFSVPMKKMSSVEEKPERLKEFRVGLKVHHDRHETVLFRLREMRGRSYSKIPRLACFSEHFGFNECGISSWAWLT